jgi:hypothetical protein
MPLPLSRYKDALQCRYTGSCASFLISESNAFQASFEINYTGDLSCDVSRYSPSVPSANLESVGKPLTGTLTSFTAIRTVGDETSDRGPRNVDHVGYTERLRSVNW